MAGTQVSPGRGGGLVPATARIAGCQRTSSAGDVSLAPSLPDGMHDTQTAAPDAIVEDAPAVPFIGALGTLATFYGRPAPNPGERPRSLSDMAPVLPVVERAAVDHQLDPVLLFSMIYTESGFNPRALSPKGAIGLIRLMSATASHYGIEDLRDPGRKVQAEAALATGTGDAGSIPCTDASTLMGSKSAGSAIGGKIRAYCRPASIANRAIDARHAAR